MLTEKDYCDYETCVALKELGFNQYNSIRYYAGVGGVKLWDFDGEPNYKEGELIALSDMYGIPSDGNEVAAPSLYEAQKWLREKHNLHIDVRLHGIIGYQCEVCTSERTITVGREFLTYEEALSEGIKSAVKILKEK